MNRQTWLHRLFRGKTVSMASLLLLAVLLNACSRAQAQGSIALTLSTQEDQLAYSQAELTTKAGQQTKLTFTNQAEALQHNWVLVKGGDEVARQVVEATLPAGVNQQSVLGSNPAILAHTALLSSGETSEIKFTAPAEAGEYTYLCTFPGHYQLGMKGKLRVEE